MQIGFIGLGTMGTPMAINLAKAGYPVRAWNRSIVSSSTSALLEIADNAKEAASEAEVLITMLADDAAVRSVLLECGLLEALRSGTVHVNMGTVSVGFAVEMTELHRSRGVTYIAAPVMGRVSVAEAGKLNILAAGDSATIDRIQPVLDVLGHKTWRFGELPKQANVVKLAANFMIASAIETMGEAAALVTGYGIAATEFLDMITTTAFAVPVYQGYGAAIAAGRFEPAGFKLALGLKDVRLLLEAAEAAHVPLPLASLLKDSHLDSLAHGEGHLDWAALAKVAARRAGAG